MKVYVVYDGTTMYGVYNQYANAIKKAEEMTESRKRQGYNDPRVYISKEKVVDIE